MPSQLLEKLRKFLDQSPPPLATSTSNQNPSKVRPATAHAMDTVMHYENLSRAEKLIYPAPNPDQPGQRPYNDAKNPHWMGTPWGAEMTKNTTQPTLGLSRVSAVNTIVIHETSGWPSFDGTANMVARFLCIAHESEWKTPKNLPPYWSSEAHGEGPQFYVDGNGTVVAMIGIRNLGPEPRITWHASNINGTSIGIENGDSGDRIGGRPTDSAKPKRTSQRVPTALTDSSGRTASGAK